MQKDIEDEGCKNKDGDISSCNRELQKRMTSDNTCPLEIGDLCVTSLGNLQSSASVDILGFLCSICYTNPYNWKQF